MVAVPEVLDRQSRRVLKAARRSWKVKEEAREMGLNELGDALPVEEVEAREPTSNRVGDWLYFGEVLATIEGDVSIEEEVRSAFSALIGAITLRSLVFAFIAEPLLLQQLFSPRTTRPSSPSRTSQSTSPRAACPSSLA